MPSSPPLSILPARPEDACDIALVYTESILARDSTMVTEPVTTADMERWLDRLSADETILVARTPDDFVGWGIVKKYSDRPGYRLACETSLFLLRSLTGRGYGSLLQKALLDWAREHGYHHVVARIWAKNRSSIALHAKFGFEMVGIQKEIGHMDGHWCDVAVMQCLLEGNV